MLRCGTHYWDTRYTNKGVNIQFITLSTERFLAEPGVTTSQNIRIVSENNQGIGIKERNVFITYKARFTKLILPIKVHLLHIEFHVNF